MFCKKGVLRNVIKFTGKHLCQSLFFNKVAGLRPAALLKKTLAQVFSCEFCEISQNTFSHRTTPVAAFGLKTEEYVKFMTQKLQFRYPCKHGKIIPFADNTLVPINGI